MDVRSSPTWRTNTIANSGAIEISDAYIADFP